LRKFFELGKYQQMVELSNGQITDITCTCKWSTIESSRIADWTLRKLCRHVKELIKKYGKIN